MTSYLKLKRVLPLALTTLTALLLAAPLAAQAATAPVKEIVTSHIGAETDKTTKANVCTVASGHECQPAKQSSKPGVFDEARSVAVDSDPASPEHGDIYVADAANKRVQVLTPSGGFVLMFGGEVNKKGGDRCTAVERSECQAGHEGSAPGQFNTPYSIAVDPTTGDVYIAEEVVSNEEFGQRVQKFTAEGAFVLEIGKEVNETTKGNLCTQTEKCKAPALRTGAELYESGGEAGSFNFKPGDGDLLAVGDNGVLYVADEQRVQEFNGEGKPVGEIRAPLEAISVYPESRVTALTVDETGNVFLVYQAVFQGGSNAPSHTVREFDPAGHEVDTVELAPQHPEGPGVGGVELEIGQLAVDPAGRLAVAEEERYRLSINGKYIEEPHIARGSLYEVGVGSARRITEFSDQFGTEIFPEASSGLAFNGEDLYASGENELDTFTPVPVASTTTTTAPCAVSGEQETDVSIACTLGGAIDPWGVRETEGSFEWGTSLSLGRKTSPSIAVASVKGEGEEEPPVAVSAPIAGLLPNEAFYYRLTAFDRNVKAPESPLLSETASAKTPSVPPRVLGTPSVSYIHAASAVLSGELNPENTVTTYEFQYAPAAGCAALETACPGTLQTASEESSAYGRIATTLEASALQPSTTYRYRLLAVNQNGEAALGETGSSQLPEGVFTTGVGPVPQASTGAASVTGPTTAVLSGSVDPDGLPATYSFELGVYAGAGTQYGVVFSGPAGEGSAPIGETLPLSGLQPGTTYAYRITISSGYIDNPAHTLQGAPATFTTAGQPSVLPVPVPLAFLAVPAIAFPNTTPPGKLAVKKTTRCAKGKHRIHGGKCTAAKKKRAKAKKSRRAPKRS